MPASLVRRPVGAAGRLPRLLLNSPGAKVSGPRPARALRRDKERTPAGSNVATWVRRSTRLVHRTPLFALHEDIFVSPQGREILYTRLESPSFSSVVPLTDDGRIVFVEQYRPPLARRLLELPGGMIEPGETPRAAAARELEEETGYRARDLTPLGWYYPSPHLGAHRGHLFLARHLSRGTAHLDVAEDLRTRTLPWNEAFRRLRSGGLHQSTAMLALFLAEPHIRRGTRRRVRTIPPGPTKALRVKSKRAPAATRGRG